jgi:hypothetical protein
MTTLPEDQRLAGISPKAYEHPADRAATAALKSIPMLDMVVRKLIELGYERALRQQFLAASVRLGEDQLPETWADWNAVCARLDLPERYDLYLTQFPITNAAAIGAGTPMVVVNSRTLDILDQLEVRTVLGHEAGHILSDHVLYRTALIILLSLSGVGPAAHLRRTAPAGCQARAAGVVPRRRALVRPRRHPRDSRSARHLPHHARARRRHVLAQAQHRRLRAPGVGVRGLGLGLGPHQPAAHGAAAHPLLPGPPVKEVMAWVHSGEYDRILGGEFVTRDQATDTRAAAGDAFEHYVQRFRGFLKDTGAGMDKAGDRVTEVADKMSDWLRSSRPGS